MHMYNVHPKLKIMMIQKVLLLSRKIWVFTYLLKVPPHRYQIKVIPSVLESV